MIAVAKHDFGICAHIYQQMNLILFMRCFCQHHPCGICTYMTGNTWQEIDSATGMQTKGQLVCAYINPLVNSQRKRSAAKLYRVNPQYQMMHHRVANQHHFKHIIWLTACLFGGT